MQDMGGHAAEPEGVRARLPASQLLPRVRSDSFLHQRAEEQVAEARVCRVTRSLPPMVVVVDGSYGQATTRQSIATTDVNSQATPANSASTEPAVGTTRGTGAAAPIAGVAGGALAATGWPGAPVAHIPGVPDGVRMGDYVGSVLASVRRLCSLRWWWCSPCAAQERTMLSWVRTAIGSFARPSSPTLRPPHTLGRMYALPVAAVAGFGVVVAELGSHTVTGIVFMLLTAAVALFLLAHAVYRYRRCVAWQSARTGVGIGSVSHA